MNRRAPTRSLLAVVAMALAAYGAAVTGEFVFDDLHSVADNTALRDLRNLWAFWTDPDTFSVGSGRMYRPALVTSFALNMAVSPSAWTFKFVNVMLHALTSGLLFAWLWRLSHRSVAATMVAMWFAVHPLLSEAVNMVSARSELLCVFGLLLGLYAHLRWSRRGPALARCGWFLAVLFATALACGSKETGVVLPGLLLVQTFCLRRRWPNLSELGRAAVVVAPAVAVVLGYLVLRKLLLGEVAVQLLDRAGGDPLSGHGRSLATQLLTMGTLLPRLVYQALVPVQLALDPEVRYVQSIADPFVWLGWLSITGLTLAALLPGPGARLRRIGAAIAWAVALPWIVVPLNVPFAEHRFYGVLLGFATALLPLANRVRRRWHAGAALPRVLWAGLLVTFCAGAHGRTLLYQDERELWQVETAARADSFRGWWGLGLARLRHGDAAGAVEPLRRAHLLYPGSYDCLRNYVEVLIAQRAERLHAEAPGLVDECALRVQQLQQRAPEDPWVRTLVVQSHLQRARLLQLDGADADDPRLVRLFGEAERLALSCLEIAEPKGYVYQLAAYARNGLGDPDGALRHLETSMRRGLATVDVQIDRVRLLREMGREPDARAGLSRLQHECPMDPRVLALTRTAAPPR